MTCPNCNALPPLCPVCGRPMLDASTRLPPRMGMSAPRPINHRWWCSQGDGKGTGHHVELTFPHQE